MQICTISRPRIARVGQGRVGGELAGVVERPLSGRRFRRREAVALVEALGVDVALVDVDLDQFDAAGNRLGEEHLDDRRADPAPTQVGDHVELVEQGHPAGVPHVGSQRHQRHGDGGVAGEDGERLRPLEEHLQTTGEHVGPWRRGVELGVEVVQQPADLGGVSNGRQTGLAVVADGHPPILGREIVQICTILLVEINSLGVGGGGGGRRRGPGSPRGRRGRSPTGRGARSRWRRRGRPRCAS